MTGMTGWEVGRMRRNAGKVGCDGNAGEVGKVERGGLLGVGKGKMVGSSLAVEWSKETDLSTDVGRSGRSQEGRECWLDLAVIAKVRDGQGRCQHGKCNG